MYDSAARQIYSNFKFEFGCKNDIEPMGSSKNVGRLNTMRQSGYMKKQKKTVKALKFQVVMAFLKVQ